VRGGQRETSEIELGGLSSGRALLAALALHVAAAGLLVVFHSQPRPLAAPASSSDAHVPDEEIAIEVSPAPLGTDPSEPRKAPEPSARSSAAPSSVAGAARAGGAAASTAATAATASVTTPAAAPGDAPSPASESAPAPGPAIVTSRSAAPDIGLALDGQNTFVTSAARGEAPNGAPAATSSPGMRPRAAAESNRAAAAMLRGTGQQHDREVGLGPEGPVLRALGDATMASFAPVKGRAVFRAITDGTGMVVGIEVLSCDGGRDGWVNAAELAREALSGKKLRLPSAATQAEMRIEIVSEMKMPSGHDPGVDVSVLGLPITKGDGPQSTQVRILDPFSLSFLAGTADPSDIGAKPRRVVHTRILESKVL